MNSSVLGKLCVVGGAGIIITSMVVWANNNYRDGLVVTPPTSLIQAVEIETEFAVPLGIENRSADPVRLVGMTWC